MARLRGHATATAKTDIVIEGFPRSANTFAVIAFEQAQHRPVSVAHHLHAVAQFRAAKRFGTPAILLLRKPRDAVISWMIFAPHVPERLLLQEYVRFHSLLQPLCGNTVVAPFETVTTDYGSIIAEVNRTYGTEFDLFFHTKENVDLCFQKMEQIGKAVGEVADRRDSKPSSRRRQLRVELEARYDNEQLRSLRAEAEILYKWFLQRASVPVATHNG